MGHTAYLYNTPYGIKRVFYCIEQIGPYYTIAKPAVFCRFWAFLGNFSMRPFSKLSVLIYNILITQNVLEKNWERFG